MDIKKLLLGIRGCKCGRDHICPIETVEISENASAALAKCAEAYKRILIVYDLLVAGIIKIITFI